LPSRPDGDHSAAARAEVAGGRELADVRELELLRRRPDLRYVDETVERESGGAAQTEAKQVSPVDHGLPRLARFRRIVRHHLPPLTESCLGTTNWAHGNRRRGPAIIGRWSYALCAEQASYNERPMFAQAFEGYLCQ
jgi:hypothetical protein